MFLVKDRRFGMDKYVFTQIDPRLDGYEGNVIEGVTLEYDMNAIHRWPDGQHRPDPQLGRDPKNSKHYKVFKFPEELRAASFEFVHSGTPFIVYSWSEYRRTYYPPAEQYAEKLSPDEWFDLLEETDFVAEKRRKTSRSDEPKRDSTRDQIAKWVATRHVWADGGIRQVLFLNSGSPADEIRLLEVSDRFTGDASDIEPVDFVLDIDGAKYKLLVADVSGDQLAKIKGNPAKWLPKGWDIDGVLAWGRRELQQ